jgi:hypothetical protein
LTNAETPTSLAASADQQTLQLPVSRLKMSNFVKVNAMEK